MNSKNYPSVNVPISKWAEEERPREKLLKEGASKLSNVELLAIVIGSGTTDSSAIEVSRSLLECNKNDLDALGVLSIHQLKKTKGIGDAKAISIKASLELGKRRAFQTKSPESPITSSKQAFQRLRNRLGDLQHEEFWILCLNRANQVLQEIMISRGGIAGTVADPKMIYEQALAYKSSGIILAHNHPSGNLKPSASDIKITNKLKNAGEFLDLPVLDHIIVGGSDYYSFADNGMIS